LDHRELADSGRGDGIPKNRHSRDSWSDLLEQLDPVWQGRTAMRISVSNWATTETDVQLSIEAMVRAVEQSRADSTT
jgi:hypothetical protein